MTAPLTSSARAAGGTPAAPGEPARGDRFPRGAASWALAAGLVVAALAAVVLVRWTVSHLPTVWMVDFSVYYAIGDWVRDGVSLYDQGVRTSVPWEIPYTYPPIAAVLLSPLSLLPFGVSVALFTVVNALSLVGVMWLSLRMMGVAAGRRRLALAVLWSGAVLVLDPVLTSVWVGQVNIILMLLVLLDVSGVVPERYRGIALGIAACIKLIPMIFVVYLFLTGRRSTAVRAVATFAVTVAIGFAVLPSASVAYWFEGVAFNVSSRTLNGIIVNHSLSGLIARLTGEVVAPNWTLVLSAVVGLLGLALAIRAHRRGQELLAVVVVGFLTLVISPITWPMHGVWIAPALVWLAYAAYRSPTLLPKVLAGLLALWFVLPLYERAQVEPLYQNTLQGNLLSTLGGTLAPAVLLLVATPFLLRRVRG